jgi:hypothetical protein
LRSCSEQRHQSAIDGKNPDASARRASRWNMPQAARPPHSMLYLIHG